MLTFIGTGAIVGIVVGIVVLVAYTVLTKKEWKIPALEIAMRAFYGIALITGIVMMNAALGPALATVHKIAAILFMALIIATVVSKLVSSKKG